MLKPELIYQVESDLHLADDKVPRLAPTCLIFP